MFRASVILDALIVRTYLLTRVQRRAVYFVGACYSASFYRRPVDEMRLLCAANTDQDVNARRDGGQPTSTYGQPGILILSSFAQYLLLSLIHI